MTWPAATEARFYEMSGEIDCECDRGGDDCTCIQDALDAAEDDAISQEEARREDRYLDGPDGSWEP